MMRKMFQLVLLGGCGLALPALAAGLVVGQKDKQFSRDSITVKAGEAVAFSNDDTVTHDITVKQPDGTRRPGIVEAPGSTSEVTFDAAGTYEVRCLIHPKMKMSVHVE